MSRFSSRYREIEAVGVGINLQPNAVRELIIGLGDRLAEVAIETSVPSYYNKLSPIDWTNRRGLKAGYRWPQYSIDRGDLHIDSVSRGSGADRRRTHFYRASLHAFRANR